MLSVRIKFHKNLQRAKFLAQFFSFSLLRAQKKKQIEEFNSITECEVPRFAKYGVYLFGQSFAIQVSREEKFLRVHEKCRSKCVQR